MKFSGRSSAGAGPREQGSSHREDRAVKIASWNINSIRVRQERLLEWLADRAPDVLCLQEIKALEAQFPSAAFRELGYESAVFGQKTYNGVAILSRLPMTEVARGFAGEVGNPPPYPPPRSVGEDQIQDHSERPLAAKQLQPSLPVTGHNSGVALVGKDSLQHLLHAWVVFNDENRTEHVPRLLARSCGSHRPGVKSPRRSPKDREPSKFQPAEKTAWWRKSSIVAVRCSRMPWGAPRVG